MQAYYTLPLFLLFCQAGWCSGNSPPRLNVGDELVVRIEEQDPFSIRCEGSQELFWNWTTGIPVDEIDIKTSQHPSTDHPFVSVLMLDYLLIQDTGWYYCHYEGAGNWRTDTNNVAKTYIFVHDGGGVFADPGQQPAIRVTTAEKLVIPCRTTLPDVYPNLTKNGIDVTQKGVFDAKVGFVLRNLVLQDSGLYICHALSYDSSPWSVLINPSSKNLTQPSITHGAGQHFVVGLRFQLNCSLMYMNGALLRWTLPNTNTLHSVSQDTVDRENSQYLVNTLTVDNATMADTGQYSCGVTAPAHRPNSNTFFVTVLETLYPFIKLNSSVSTINLTEGEPLRWGPEVHAFPPDPILIFLNWTGHELQESERVVTEHQAISARSWLRIHNVTAYDHGRYVLEGKTRQQKINGSVAVLVKIRSKPSPWLEDVPQYVTPGASVNVSCVARGFPLPVTAWRFKSCPDGTHDCTSNYVPLEDSEGNSTVRAPGNVIAFPMTLTPNESGVVSCRVSNDEGEAEVTAKLPISDVGGLLVLRSTVEGTEKEVSGDKSTITVVANDTFHLLCAAAKFTYYPVQLHFAGSGPKLEVTETNWSWQESVLEGKVTTAHQGSYTCNAPLLNGSHTVVKTLQLIVQGEKGVEFLPDATLTTDGRTRFVKEKKNITLSCSVSGTPRPTVTWFKDNKELLQTSSYFDNETTFLSSDGQRLEIKYVFRERHVGKYECIAKNRINTLYGYINLDVQGPGLSTGTKIGLGVALVGIVLLVVLVVFLVCRVKTEKKFRKSFRRNELYLFEKGNIGQLNPDCTADEQAELLPYGQEWEVPRDDIILGKQLGSGAFGRVVKAIVTDLEDDCPTTTVAIKMCKNMSDAAQVRSLALELKIMNHLGKHLNIVNLMGANTVNFGKGDLWILVEYCRFGNILTFLHRHRRQFVNQIDPNTGRIDPSCVRNPASPITANSQGSSGFRPAPITDQDGYLAPASTKFTLADPPKGRSSMVSPSEADVEAGPRQIVSNPLYTGANMQGDAGDDGTGVGSAPGISSHPNATSPDPSVTSPTSPTFPHPTVTSPTSPGPQQAPPFSPTSPHPISPMSNQPLLPSQISPGVPPHPLSGETDGHLSPRTVITNTDMTTVQSVPSEPFSPSPFSPMDSSRNSDMMVDSHGNPFSYEVGNVPGVTAPFTTSDLVCWGWQVAQGMDYLASRKVLHGDLAARNLLLAESNVVKISDFGLSRDMYKKDIYMKKADDLMPIKWISVEAIRDRIFSVQSDVWAYGVTLWELFSLGGVPYPGVEVDKDFLSLLEDGHRMNRPKFANQEIYDFLLRCWSSEPMERPSFKDAAEFLGTLMLPDLRGEYMTMNDPYLRMNEERFQNQTDYLKMMSSPDYQTMTQGEEEVSLDGVTSPSYVNIQPNSGANINGNKHSYLSMDAANPKPSPQPDPHYLPMDSTASPAKNRTPGPQSAPSPMVDVFSPRPEEPSRFTFVPGSVGTPRLPEVVEEDEERPLSHAKENSNLINENPSVSSTLHGHQSPVLSEDDELNSELEDDVDLGRSNEEVVYMNLSRTDSNYIKM